ncbi:MAG: hypothetical protein ACI8TQ_003996 [Planctomycetota bacterium]|jgi:hypothetical protein
MIQFSNPVLSGVSGRRSSKAVRAHFGANLFPLFLGVLFAAPAAAAAGGTQFLVSTSSDVAQAGSVPAVDDGALVRIEAGVSASVRFHQGHWQGVAGLIPGDIDGMARRPGMDPASHRALAFTLLSDEAGFKDGDVLGLAQGGGFEVLHFESDIQTELGASGLAIDLDGIAFDDQGRLIFSLQANLASSVIGPLDDGDVLRLESGGGVSRLFTEADVQSMVSSVTGSSSAISDVLALEFMNGDVWVSVQSPSANDGSIFSLGSVPAMVLSEADAGLGGSEIDALVWSDPISQKGCLTFDFETAAPGAILQADFDGGTAGHPIAILVAGNSGYFATDGLLAGYGGIYIDLLDPWFNMFGSVPVISTDSVGGFQRTVTLPANAAGGIGFDGSAGWTFQTIDLMSLELSAPFRIELE